MRSGLFITRFFFSGLAVSMLLIAPGILDLSLMPRFITLAVTVSLVFYFLYRSGGTFYFKADLISGVYLLYVLFSICSICWATNTAEALLEATRTLLAFFVFLLAYTAIKMQPEDFTEQLLKLSVVAVFILFPVVFVQLLEIKSLDKASVYGITGINGHKNLASSFLFLNLFFVTRAYTQLNGKWKIVSAITLMFTLLLMLFLRTKSVWLGCLVCFFVYLLLDKNIMQKVTIKCNSYLKVAVLVILANLFFIFLLQPFIQRALLYNARRENGSAQFDPERLMVWEKTYAIFSKHKVVGVGAGNWQVNYPDATLTGLYRAEDLNFTFQRPHNDFLWILSETGLVGFNLFLVFVCSLIVFSLPAVKTAADDPGGRKNVVFHIAFVLGYLCIAFFDFPKERIEHTILINIIFGMIYYRIRQNNGLQIVATLKLNKLVYAALIGAGAGIAIVGCFRAWGEFHVRKMYDYKISNQNTQLVRSGQSATSFAYTLDPTSVPLFWYIGNAEAKMNNYQGALTDFKKAYKLNPFNRNVLNDLASCYASMNNTAMAKKYYLEAIRISPRFDDPKLNLVAIYIREKQFSLAAECIQTLYHDSERRTQYQKIIDVFSKNN